MNKMKSVLRASLLALLTVSALSPLTALAGPGGTGGGKGVVCRDARGAIKSVELLDLWEARTIYGRQVDQNRKPVETIVGETITRLKDSLSTQISVTLSNGTQAKGPAAIGLILSQSAELFLKNYANVNRLQNVKLNLTDDSFETAQPKDCPVEQIVIYQDNQEGTANILLNADLYSKMNNLNKAALIVHEAYYKFLRDQGNEKTSLRTRRAVGLAMSNHTFHNLTEDVPSRYLRCRSQDNYIEALPGDKRHSTVYLRETDINGTTYVTAKVETLFGAPMIDVDWTSMSISSGTLESILAPVAQLAYINIKTSASVDTETRAYLKISKDPQYGVGSVSIAVRESTLNRDTLPWQKMECEMIGGATKVACPIGYAFLESAGVCNYIGQCAPGQVVNPADPKTCLNSNTGMNVGQQKCMSGYALTMQGCLPLTSNCARGQALLGNTCLAIIE